MVLLKMEMANGWIIVCPLGTSTDADAMGDSTLYIEASERRVLKTGHENLPARPSDGTMRETLASGWFDDSDLSEFASQPWYQYRDRIQNVKILDTWSPVNGKYLFDGLSNCEEFDLLKLNTSRCSSFEGMFRGCSSVKQLFDLDSLETERVTNVSHMFLNCLSLKAVSIAGWKVSNINKFDHMLSGCSAYLLANSSQKAFLETVTSTSAEHGVWRKSLG